MSRREAAVSGQFYPSDPAELSRCVEDLLAEAQVPVDFAPTGGSAPVRAYVVPHAGFVYSGPVAATAYAHLRRSGFEPTRVLLLGPSHRVPLRGLATSSASTFETPLGPMPIAQALRERLVQEGLCQVDDAPHLREHSLEVQLPFLRRVLPDAELLPVVGGETEPEAVAALLEAVWDDSQTLILLSSDLSHFLPYEEAVEMDAETATYLEALDPRALLPGRACGRVGLGGLIALARRRPLTLERLDLRNSGDTFGAKAGQRSGGEVVGYSAWAVREIVD